MPRKNRERKSSSVCEAPLSSSSAKVIRDLSDDNFSKLLDGAFQPQYSSKLIRSASTEGILLRGLYQETQEEDKMSGAVDYDGIPLIDDNSDSAEYVPFFDGRRQTKTDSSPSPLQATISAPPLMYTRGNVEKTVAELHDDIEMGMASEEPQGRAFSGALRMEDGTTVLGPQCEDVGRFTGLAREDIIATDMTPKHCWSGGAYDLDYNFMKEPRFCDKEVKMARIEAERKILSKRAKKEKKFQQYQTATWGLPNEEVDVDKIVEQIEGKQPPKSAKRNQKKRKAAGGGVVCSIPAETADSSLVLLSPPSFTSISSTLPRALSPPESPPIDDQLSSQVESVENKKEKEEKKVDRGSNSKKSKSEKTTAPAAVHEERKQPTTIGSQHSLPLSSPTPVPLPSTTTALPLIPHNNNNRIHNSVPPKGKTRMVPATKNGADVEGTPAASRGAHRTTSEEADEEYVSADEAPQWSHEEMVEGHAASETLLDGNNFRADHETISALSAELTRHTQLNDDEFTVVAKGKKKLDKDKRTMSMSGSDRDRLKDSAARRASLGLHEGAAPAAVGRRLPNEHGDRPPPPGHPPGSFKKPAVAGSLADFIDDKHKLTHIHTRQWMTRKSGGGVRHDSVGSSSRREDEEDLPALTVSLPPLSSVASNSNDSTPMMSPQAQMTASASDDVSAPRAFSYADAAKKSSAGSSRQGSPLNASPASSGESPPAAAPSPLPASSAESSSTPAAAAPIDSASAPSGTAAQASSSAQPPQAMASSSSTSGISFFYDESVDEQKNEEERGEGGDSLVLRLGEGRVLCLPRGTMVADDRHAALIDAVQKHWLFFLQGSQPDSYP